MALSSVQLAVAKETFVFVGYSSKMKAIDEEDVMRSLL